LIIRSLTCSMTPIRQPLLKSNRNADPQPKGHVRPTRPSNERNISEDQPIDLGSLNGKPFIVRIVPGAGIEWNGCPGVRAPNSPVVSEEVRAAARAARMYSAAEHKVAQEAVGVIGALYGYTQGKLRMGYINDMIRQCQLAPDTVKGILTRLGIDPERPFRINGQHLAFVNGLISPCDGGIAPNEASTSGDSDRGSPAVAPLAQPASAAIDGSYQSRTTLTSMAICHEDRLSPPECIDLRTETFVPMGSTNIPTTDAESEFWSRIKAHLWQRLAAAHKAEPVRALHSRVMERSRESAVHYDSLLG
jgi:hypothetical protein